MQIVKPAIASLTPKEPTPEATKTSKTAKIDDASRKLESQFTQMLVKCMRDASFGDSMFPQENQTYRDLYDRQLSDLLSQGKGLGLRPLIARQLGADVGAEQADASPERLVDPIPSKKSVAFYQRFPGGTAAAEAIDAIAGRASGTGSIGGRAPAELMPDTRVASEACDEVETIAKADADKFRSGTPEHFVAKIWPHAERAARELGVDPRALVAQAALETGWGRRGIRDGEGNSSNNLFGIKAAGWTGNRVNTSTHEYVNGARRSERADFRTYASPAESFSDYVRMLKSNPRYQQVLQAGADVRQFATELQRAGYATDPAYAKKIYAIANGPTLGRALDGVVGNLVASR